MKLFNSIIVAVMLVTSLTNILLFVSKWVESDFDTAWELFETFVENCMAGGA